MAFDATMTHRHPPPPLCLWSPQDCYWYMRAAGDGGSESGKRGKAKLPAGRRTSLDRANSTSPCLLYSAFVLAMEIAKVLGNRKECFMIFGNWFILTWSIKAGKQRLVVAVGSAPKPELSWQKGINESPWRGPTRCVTSLAFIASWVWFLLLVVFFALQALQKKWKWSKRKILIGNNKKLLINLARLPRTHSQSLNIYFSLRSPLHWRVLLSGINLVSGSQGVLVNWTDRVEVYEFCHDKS